MLREISPAKNNIIDPTEFRALFEGDKSMMKIADIYQTYDDAKADKMLLDFDDLLLESYYLLVTMRIYGKIIKPACRDASGHNQAQHYHLGSSSGRKGRKKTY